MDFINRLKFYQNPFSIAISNAFVTLYFLNHCRIYQELKCNVASQANKLQYKE